MTVRLLTPRHQGPSVVSALRAATDLRAEALRYKTCGR